jgi:hypothetical protein
MVMEYSFPDPVYYRDWSKHPRGPILNNMPKEGIGIEIGVWQGGFSDLLLHWTQPKEMHLVDPFETVHDDDHEGAFYHGDDQNMDQAYIFVRSRFAREIADGRVILWRAKSQDIADQFEDNYFDWIYIDGDHSYEAVKRDLDLYLPKLKPGGWLVGDDYGAVHEWWGDGIMRAVMDTLAENENIALDAVIGGQFVIFKFDPKEDNDPEADSTGNSIET